jgi:hypothetical protein
MAVGESERSLLSARGYSREQIDSMNEAELDQELAEAKAARPGVPRWAVAGATGPRVRQGERLRRAIIIIVGAAVVLVAASIALQHCDYPRGSEPVCRTLFRAVLTALLPN